MHTGETRKKQHASQRASELAIKHTSPHTSRATTKLLSCTDGHSRETFDLLIEGGFIVGGTTNQLLRAHCEPCGGHSKYFTRYKGTRQHNTAHQQAKEGVCRWLLCASNKETDRQTKQRPTPMSHNTYISTRHTNFLPKLSAHTHTYIPAQCAHTLPLAPANPIRVLCIKCVSSAAHHQTRS